MGKGRGNPAVGAGLFDDDLPHGPAFGAPLAGAPAGCAVYADGGLAGPNPATAAAWAWCLVSPAGERLVGRSGVVTAADCLAPAVSNNVAELAAVLAAAEALPPEYSGDLFTDSAVTLSRWNRGPRESTRGLPDWMLPRLVAARSRVRLTARLVAGHPTPADLARGATASGVPVSEHNVWCDAACTAAALAWLAASESRPAGIPPVPTLPVV